MCTQSQAACTVDARTVTSQLPQSALRRTTGEVILCRGAPRRGGTVYPPGSALDGREARYTRLLLTHLGSAGRPSANRRGSPAVLRLVTETRHHCGLRAPAEWPAGVDRPYQPSDADSGSGSGPTISPGGADTGQIAQQRTQGEVYVRTYSLSQIQYIMLTQQRTQSGVYVCKYSRSHH